MVADIKPIAEIQQRTGVPIECGAFIGSSPIRQFAEGWTLDFLEKCTEDALAFAAREGVTRDVRHGGHDARGSRVAAASVHHGDSRRRQAAVRRRHGRACDAERRESGGEVREVADRRARRGRRHRLARPPRSRVRRRVEPGGARGRRDAPARRGARHRRAVRQHADRSADGQPGDDGVSQQRSDGAAGLRAGGRGRVRRARSRRTTR